MSKSMIKTMDPQEIQNRFSSDQYLLMQSDSSTFTFEDFQPFLDRLPQREIDLIDMYYRDQKKQKEIAEFFGVTQGAISHRLSRARKRLDFLRDMPKIMGSLRDILEGHFDGFEVDVIAYMTETTCQSRTAELLNQKYRLQGKNRMTQVKVRHKFDRSIERLKKLKKSHYEWRICFELAFYVKENLYMLHEVVLPHFNRGHRHKYNEIR